MKKVKRDVGHIFGAERSWLSHEAIPEPPDNAILRPALLARLNAGLQRPLTVLVAPLGYGKTTLVASWLEALSHPVIWMTLHLTDNDPTAFWWRVEQALDHLPGLNPARPGRVVYSGDLLASEAPQAGFQRVEERLIRIGRGWQAPEKIIWVLDDFHHIRNALLLEQINLLLDRCPPRLQVMVMARAMPNLQVARRRVEDRVVELDVQSLRFNLEETRQYLSLRMQRPLSEADLATVQARSEGWVAALHLLSRTPEPEVDWQRLIQQQGALSDYLLEEVYQYVSGRQRTLLACASRLPWFCASLLNTLLGQEDSASLIADLQRDALLIQPVEGLELPPGETAYRLHDLFRDWLRLQTSDAPAGDAWLMQAAHWMEGQGDILTALDLLIEGQYWGALNAMLERVLEGCLQKGYIYPVLNRLGGIALPIRKGYVWLALLDAFNEFRQGRFQSALSQLRALEANNPDQPKLTLVCQFGRCQIATYSGDQALMQETLAAMQANPGFTASPLSPWIQQTRAVSQLFAGELTAARERLIDAARESEAQGDFHAYTVCISWLVPCFLFAGELGLARRWIQQLETKLEAVAEDSPAHALPHYLTAGLLREQNELDAAEKALRQAWELGIEQLTQIDQTYFHLQDWSLAMNRRQFERANQLMEDLRFQQGLSSRPWHSLYPSPELLKRLQNAVQGHPQELVVWAMEHEWADFTEGQLQGFGTRLNWIRTRQALGQSCEDELSSLEEWARSENARYFVLRILLTRAIWHLGQDEMALAGKIMVEALRLSRQHGFTQILLEEGERLTPLLDQIDGNLTLETEVQRLRLHLAPKESPSLSPGSKEAPEAEGLDPLSPREQEILGWLNEGLSNQQLADRLSISLPTVKSHLRNLYSKLDVTSRTQALARARALSLI
ncbi:MAG: winged helix-turn-helix transcriptional regulator [Hahellaceae bacterium]|nr:winged helix-turn-helix transcriptional regulator [Hahellaceae bacterium]